MSVAVQPPSHSSPLRPRDSDHNMSSSPHSHGPIAPPRTSNGDMRRSISSSSSSGPRAVRNNGSRSPSREATRNNSRGKVASSNSNSSPNVPVIKKERPSSSEGHRLPPPPPSAPPTTTVPPSRHRPRKLDLSRGKPPGPGASTGGQRPSAPLTSKESGSLSAMHDVGMACLSPGFQTHDPSMQQQLARSMEMREQQRQIIESRLHGKTSSQDKPMPDAGPQTSAFAKAPSTSKRKGPPPGLSISAPSHEQFASEPRVIQSAPLNQTFTGLKPPSSLARQILDPQRQHQLGSGQPSSQHTANRLPPISDVIASESLGSARREEAMHRPNSGFHAPHSTYSPAHPTTHGPLHSPGYPPPPASAGFHPPRTHEGHQVQDPPGSSRRREYKSAEEALQTMSGGREDLLPKMVHYGGHQPPTPPSPHSRQHASQHPSASLRPEVALRSASGRRRTRDEYERDHGEADKMDVDQREREKGRAGPRYGMWDEDTRESSRRYAPFGQTQESPETTRRKKDEFLSLCSRAWDLFHS